MLSHVQIDTHLSRTGEAKLKRQMVDVRHRPLLVDSGASQKGKDHIYIEYRGFVMRGA